MTQKAIKEPLRLVNANKIHLHIVALTIFIGAERLFLGVLDVLIYAKCELFKNKNIFAFDYYALCFLEQVHLCFLPRYKHAKISYRAQGFLFKIFRLAFKSEKECQKLVYQGKS